MLPIAVEAAHKAVSCWWNQQSNMKQEELQAQKLQLEIDKLNTDIEKGNAPFYKTSDFWKSIIPTLITTGAVFATLYFTVGRSFIDDEKRKLELQKEQLKLEVLQFEGVKLDIQKQIASSTIDKNSLFSKIKLLQSQKNKLGGNIASLTKDVNDLNADIKSLNWESSALKSENREVRAEYSKDTSFYKTQLDKKYSQEIS